MKRWERWARGRERAIGAVAVAAAAAVALVVGSLVDERQGRSAAGGSSGAGPGARAGDPSRSEPLPANGAQRPPHVDYLLDLNTGSTIPLPRAILRSLGDLRARDAGWSRYAVSPDRSRLAFVGLGDKGRPQIFIANLLDGSGIHQVTHDLKAARSPAWSPDSRHIAYEGYGDGDGSHLYVVDVETRYANRITDGVGAADGYTPQFTPDGSSLVYTGGSGHLPGLRTVPIAGGHSRLLFPLNGGLEDSGDGSLSPDGSLVTFLGSGTFSFGHCGPCRWLADADGTHRRVIDGCFEANPAGTWWRQHGGRGPHLGIAVLRAWTIFAYRPSDALFTNTRPFTVARSIMRSTAPRRHRGRRRRHRGRGRGRVRSGCASPRARPRADPVTARHGGDQRLEPSPPAMPITSAPPAIASSASWSMLLPDPSTTASMLRARHSPARSNRTAFPPPDFGFISSTGCVAAGAGLPGWAQPEPDRGRCAVPTWRRPPTARPAPLRQRPPPHDVGDADRRHQQDAVRRRRQQGRRTGSTPARHCLRAGADQHDDFQQGDDQPSAVVQRRNHRKQHCRRGREQRDGRDDRLRAALSLKSWSPDLSGSIRLRTARGSAATTCWPRRNRPGSAAAEA